MKGLLNSLENLIWNRILPQGDPVRIRDPINDPLGLSLVYSNYHKLSNGAQRFHCTNLNFKRIRQLFADLRIIRFPGDIACCLVWFQDQ